jgi:regulator of RNase E activity RraA
LTAPTISPATLKKLAQYDSPTICNVIELFEVRPDDAGYMDGRIKAAYPDMPPVVGFAATATFRSCAGARGKAYATLTTQLEQFERLGGPAFVVFQDLDDPAIGATFGEVMCSVYQAFGSVGLITSGGGRDLLQVRALGYPVFCGSTIVSHAYCQILELDVLVRVGGLVVQSGDLLHGDANGVTSIPLEIAAEVADAAEEFVAAENYVLDYVKGKGPKKVSEFTQKRQALTEAVSALRKRVSRKGKVS